MISAEDLHKAADELPLGDDLEAGEAFLGVEPGALERFLNEAVFRPEGDEEARLVVDDLALAYGISIGIAAGRAAS